MLKSKFAFYLTLVAGLINFAGNTYGQGSEVAKTPNVVLIMADDLGWKDLHCYGNEKLDTPNIDRLAQQGLLFTDAYSAAPVCTPTRAALMTGESPARLNITNHAGGHPPNFKKPGTDLITPQWLRYLPLSRVTLAEQLRQAGYSTGFVGKWHLSSTRHAVADANNKRPTEPELRAEHQGFDINIGGCRFGGPPGYFSPYKIPNLIGKKDGEYLPDRCADECIDFIKSAQGGRPAIFSLLVELFRPLSFSGTRRSDCQVRKAKRTWHRKPNIRGNDRRDGCFNRQAPESDRRPGPG